MKTNGKTFIILGITFILCSAIWFLWVRNIAMGIVWLAIGILELCIAAILYWTGKLPKPVDMFLTNRQIVDMFLDAILRTGSNQWTSSRLLAQV